ncbi:hypothetical protein C2S52_005209 [Perilla frutescens var. hirtella]|nr:hypothetical protein C2S52_005209 [Perilla frutescens var. hirtella]
MAETAVTFLVERVKNVLKEYNDDLKSDAEDELRKLSNEVGLLKAFLHDASTAATTTKRERFMVREIREVVYKVEDSIDIWLSEAMISCLKPAFFHYWKRRRNSLRKEVNFIRVCKVLPLFEELKIMKVATIADGSQHPLTKSKRDIRIPVKKNRLVGFEDMEAKLTECLMEETNELDVISIIAMPGLGKTELAWKIYEAESIRYHFPTRIWVYVSHRFSRREVFLQILKNLITVQDISNLSDDKLAQTLRSRLEKERFLLVLDDVWSVDAWEEIKQVLPLSNRKAKVVITSRERNVGKQSCVHREPFFLRLLNLEESWELLQYEVFGNLEDWPEELIATGKLIASKCDGVPPTIVMAGGILSDLQARGVPMEEWERVSEDVIALRDDDRARLATDIVALSYNRLPDYLRECFLYLGVFPEDYEIPVKMLLSLWIAEGFIWPEDGRTMEESAEENMNDLIRNNLLSVEKTNHMGKVKTCRVHEMIKVFCRKKSYKANSFQVMRQSKTGEIHPPVSEVEKLDRLIFNYDPSTFLSRSPNGPHVRSFFCFYEQYVELKPEYALAMLEGFPKLRILEFKSIKLHQFPSKFMKLIHLRYLTLYVDNLTILPEAISQLWNLQTLVAETGSHSITMRANIWKMIQLRRLETNAALVLDSKWEGEAGENLQTLNRLSPESCTEAVSRRARNLKTLGIYGKLANAFGTRFLEQLHHLEKLKLVNSLIYEGTTPEDFLRGLPQRNCFPPNLKRLTLRNTFLDWRHMSTLAMIKSLKALKLKDNAFLGKHWEVSGHSFPNLQFLLIVNTNLVHWKTSAEAFPSLRYLVVKNCEKLEQIPECLGTTHLEKLEIERVQKSAVESARRIERQIKAGQKGKFKLKIGVACET